MKSAKHDPVPNRFRFSLLLREIDGMLADPEVSTIALVLIQVSGLEDVNGRFGYVGGDLVLDEFGARLAAAVRDQDRTFGMSGTLFALLIRNPLHEGHAVLAAQKVAALASDPVAIGPGAARIRIRTGLSFLPHPAQSGEELLRQCELALEVARRRDEPYVVFTPTAQEIREIATTHTWFDLEEALRAGEFELHYQPKVDLATGQVSGAEALIRWQSPRLGLVPPGQFIPVIEHTQGIRGLLRYSLNAALRQAASWSSAIPGFSVAVNLAPGNLADDDLIDLVRGALGVWNLPPRQLILELTESSLMSDPAAGIAAMSRLRALGARTSIDDFGTGYSSLAYLKDVPADELKIDRSFISQIAGEEKHRRIVASMIQLGHAVGLTVVGEGIEDHATAATLTAISCDTGQGFHFGAPVTATEFEQRYLGPPGRIHSSGS